MRGRWTCTPTGRAARRPRRPRRAQDAAVPGTPPETQPETQPAPGLPADARDRLLRLLTAELGTACTTALTAGAALADLGAIIGDRTRAVEAMRAGGDDDRPPSGTGSSGCSWPCRYPGTTLPVDP
ncbi:hypothetical protein [Dactylosporangium sp. NPDC005555]|uniref:hypothetical protein n=1 Tax=Dactylosporangium sp. NPDC005555 TaxID=3154889 RepID=UPI0033A17C28